MTTIAIIGGGIAARSLLYAMARRNFSQKILVFYSERFAFPCSLHSTAIVAPRGVSTGHSELGDSLVEGFDRFARHVTEDAPEGVIRVPQYTGAISKLEAFQKRYPSGERSRMAGSIGLCEEAYLAREEAYLIRPRDYLDWLLKEARSLDLTLIHSFVVEVHGNIIRTQEGEEYTADKIIFTAGVQNSLWSSLFTQGKKSKSVQGCYLEFHNVDFGESFSLTLEGDNVIHDQERKTLLIGSTTNETALEVPQEKALLKIYERVSSRLDLKLPSFEEGLMRTGLREKAQKRQAYLLKEGNYSVLGGLYKNGYRMSLYLSEKLLSLE